MVALAAKTGWGPSVRAVLRPLDLFGIRFGGTFIALRFASGYVVHPGKQVATVRRVVYLHKFNKFRPEFSIGNLTVQITI